MNYAKNCSGWRRVKGMRLNRLGGILLLLAFTLSGGCAPVRPSVTELPLPSVEDLLQGLAEQGRRFHSLQGMASLRVTTGGEEQTVKQALLVQRPDLFRAEVLGLFGQPVLTVAAADNRLSASVPGEGAFYTGPASPENLYRLVRFPLELKELLQFVFSDVPLLPQGGREVAFDGGLYRIDRQSFGQRRQELYFDGQKRLRQVRFFAGDTELLHAEYDAFREGDGLPMRLHLRLPAVDTEIELAWRDVRTNTHIPPERFRLTPPPGARIMALP